MSKIKIHKKRASTLEEILEKLFLSIDGIKPLTDTMYEVIVEGKSGIFSIEDGSLVLSIEYDPTIELGRRDLRVLRKNRKFGIFSLKTRSIVLPVNCTKLTYRDENHFNVEQEGKVGTFNIGTNQLVIE